MTAQRKQATAKDGCCKGCGAKLGLLQRVTKQEFCSPAHRNDYLRSQENLALACLQDAMVAHEDNGPQPSIELAGISADMMPPDDLLAAAMAAPPPSAPPPIESFAEEQAEPPVVTEGEHDPDGAGFVDLGYCLGPAYLAEHDITECPFPITTVIPARPESLAAEQVMPWGGCVPIPVPSRSLVSEWLPDTGGALPSPAPEDSFPRLACVVAGFDWDEAHRAEIARIEREREPGEAGPVALPAPPPRVLNPDLVSHSPTAGPWKSSSRLVSPWLALANSATSVRKALPSPSVSMMVLSGPPAQPPPPEFHRESTTAERPSALPNLPSPELGLASEALKSGPSAPPEALEIFPLPPPPIRAGITELARSSGEPAAQAPFLVEPHLRLAVTGTRCVGLAQAVAADPATLPQVMAPGAAAPEREPVEQGGFEIFAAQPDLIPLTGRAHPRPPGGAPPPARKGMRARIGVLDPGGVALLDPFPCPFGGQEEVWQPEL